MKARKQSVRIQTSLLNAAEHKLLLWLAGRLPAWVSSDLLTFTGYTGYDPEVDTSSKSNPMCPGIDYAAYPKSRSYVAGINVSF